MSVHESSLRGRAAPFPATHYSAVLAVRSGDDAERQRAYAALAEAYWKPIYKYLRLRRRLDHESARDLTQGFFAQALESGWFERYDAQRAAFRTYLRMCLDGYVANERKAAGRQKRGGGRVIVPLDFDLAERELAGQPSPSGDDEAVFHQEWVRSLFQRAVERLREQCLQDGRALHFELFERYDLRRDQDDGPPTYQHLADATQLSVAQVTNHLYAVRQQFRAIVLRELRLTTAGESEFQAEAAALFGAVPR